MKNKIPGLSPTFYLAFALCSAFAVVFGWLLAFRPQQARAESAAALRYVAKTGLDSGGCTTLGSPCLTIQYAVDQSTPGDEIRVASGVYNGVNTLGSMKQVVYIAKNLTIRGGYNADFSVQNPQLYPTQIDAENLGRGISIMGPATVQIEGLRVTNGKSTDIGGLYMGAYSCNTLSGRGAGGGVCIQNATATLNLVEIMTNTASTKGGQGGGLMATGSVITLTNSTIQGNNAGTGSNYSYGGGMFLTGGLAWIEGNVISDNNANPNYDGDGGGVLAWETTAVVQDNLIQNNFVRGNTSSPSRLGGAGVAANGGQVTLHANQIIDNEASNYTGGGLAWANGSITVTANLILSNTAAWGGGAYVGNAPANLENNVIANNIATTHGSALYINTFNPNRPELRHNTIARNSGGDKSAIYVADYGRASFYNTILAENEIGVAVAWSTSISFERTLWDTNITDTVGLIDEVGHLDGSAAFAVDGYHLTETSDAVDAGIDAGTTTDVDGETRPRGSAPDIGADESPYGQSVVNTNVNVEKVALPPRLMLTTRSLSGQPLYLIQQEYLIQIANGLTETALSQYSATDWLPSELDYAAQTGYPPMSFNQAGNTLHWDSQSALPAGNLAWISLVGNALPDDGGKVVTNTANVAYTLSGGDSYSEDVEAASLIPNFPPFITFPENGEYCLDQSGNLEIWGLAKPGAAISVYEDGAFITQVTASISGTFYASYQPAHWAPDSPVTLTTRDCTNGTCGEPSNAVAVRMSERGWCPQRSVWEGKAGENTYRWPFRDQNGNMSTIDWEIPGFYGFNHTTLKIYQCDVPDAGYSVTSVVVVADGVAYEDADGPDAQGSWSFSIAYAHSVSIVVSAENSVGATKTYSSYGSVLIDPDGFIFDVTQGLDVISSTTVGVPLEVINTVQGVTVTCMVSMPQWGGWVPWPAYVYNNQVNPQVTGEDGYFAFFTPPGLYYLQVEGNEAFQSWRSPVIEVITEIVHVNVPLTPISIDQNPTAIILTPEGPDQDVITVPVGSQVTWVSALDSQTQVSDLAQWMRNPVLQVLSDLDPLTDTHGWDSGMLSPGAVYERKFTRPGVYFYSDGVGHVGKVVVPGVLYLPMIVR